MKRTRRYFVQESDAARFIQPVGRDAWMLDRLLEAGPAGCTSLENPAPRVSHYIFKLRSVYGLDIETITEPHDGLYAGHHARYVLRTRVTALGEGDAAKAA
ncbi:winged helix domain-containing protein [Reyranella sp.]|uniref:winged helix domain-containing protein n=1 Tax=Reyranella sp. TaxID=1929291 RepID=UPI0040362BC1